MNLYRIILVDDEEEVRKSIIKKIDWQSAGFQVVGDAENGQDALEKIEALKPEVVLTDIRMPYMDGLTLAGKLRQKYPSIKLVIFSGFDDFEYAKQAIKLNVIEYILKPVNVEELTAILQKIKFNLDEEIAQRRNVDILRENYRKSIPIIREQFLNDFIRRPFSEDEAKEKLQEYDVPILGAKKWVAVAIDIEDGEISRENSLSFHKEKELIPVSVRQMLKEMLEGCFRIALFTASMDSRQVILAAIDEGKTQTGFITIMEDVCKEIKRVLEVPITAGIGKGCTSLSEMPLSYQSAVDALGYKAMVGTGGTIYIYDVEPMTRGKLLWESRDEEELFAAVKFGPKSRIQTLTEEIAARLDGAKVHASQQQVYQISIVTSVVRLIQQYDMDLSELFGREGSYQEIIGKIVKGEMFGNWLFHTCCHIHERMSQERESSMQQVIQEARRYIQENYPDPELSVEKICRHLHMSPAYFSTMFKKETGQAYTAYLTEVRLNQAVELLRMTNDKTYVIAAKVGYQEQNYFSYVFKKRFGVSPTKFRGAQL
ncbi:MAG: response regulator [Lachnospiraceae bacterium]|nr:response regulator [Lachnospiraceae bacterium]